MPLLFWRALIFLVAVAASGTVFYWLARSRRVRLSPPRVLRGIAALLGATTILLCVYALFNEQVASSTMSDFRAAAIHYACVRNRITSFPNKECTVTWFAALKYRFAKLRARLSNPRPPRLPCGDEYSVYVAAINNDFWHLVRHTGQLVVLEDSTSSFWGAPLPAPFPEDNATVLAELLWEAEPSTVHAFLEANRVPALIEPFATEPPTAILPRPLLDSLRAATVGGHWSRTFYDRYPTAKGQFALSRAGISSDHRQAILEFDGLWDHYSGGSGLVLLMCKDGTWSLVDSLFMRGGS
jgi:hypothetical protein